MPLSPIAFEVMESLATVSSVGAAGAAESSAIRQCLEELIPVFFSFSIGRRDKTGSEQESHLVSIAQVDCTAATGSGECKSNFQSGTAKVKDNLGVEVKKFWRKSRKVLVGVAVFQHLKALAFSVSRLCTEQVEPWEK
ncbi:hypothetical protein DFJ73DRAFT_756223 [Zopfochytrium polystomum]|nr:hypothetical protein DFJ73DRAFT_756223 [Zopfochytrium polystomum]